MRRRRWAILATTLVALNLFFWLAPPGLALRAALVDQLFGPRMVRAEVIVLGPTGTPLDYRIDRGDLASVTATSVTLNEADGTQQTIPIDQSTRVVGLPRRFSLTSLPRGVTLRVLVVHLANGPAQTIQVEGRGP